MKKVGTMICAVLISFLCACSNTTGTGTQFVTQEYGSISTQPEPTDATTSDPETEETTENVTTEEATTAEPTSEETMPEETTPDTRAPIEYDATDLANEAYWRPIVNDALAAGKKVVYLTFDDGCSTLTPQVLEILDRYGVKATFFPVGNFTTADRTYLYNQIRSKGHTLGMHSLTHDRPTMYASLENFKAEFYAMHDFVYEQTGGYSAWLWRFPGGSSTRYSGMNMYNEYIPFLDSMNVKFYDWNISSEDAMVEATAQSVYDNVIGSIKKSYMKEFVVLMHDGFAREATVEALPNIIKTLQEMDCVLAPITIGTTPVHHSVIER